jgi:DNA-binding response OmpR family regulator
VYRLRTDILCVETSDDVLAFVRQLLGQAGYGVQTANNLPDALMLLKAARPKLLVIGAGIRAAHGTQAAETFQRLASSVSIVELPDDFSNRDAGAAAHSVLAQVRTFIGAGDPSATGRS